MAGHLYHDFMATSQWSNPLHNGIGTRQGSNSRSRGTTVKFTSILLAVFAVACASQEEEGARCEVFESSGTSRDGAVAIGSSAPGDFVSIDNDGTMELELGIQGGWMARPSLEIDAASLGADEESCIWVSIDATIDGMDQPISVLETPAFQFQDGMAYSAPLNLLLSFDLEALEGRTATFHVTVQGPEAAATSIVDVTLVNHE